MVKNLVFVTTRLFWPADSGHKVVLFNYCKAFHELYGYDVYLYSFLDAGQTYAEESVPDFIKEVRIAKAPSHGRIVLNLLRVLGEGNLPFQCALFYDPHAFSELEKYTKEINPIISIIDMVRLSPYLDALPKDGMRIVFFDDLLSKRYRRQASENGSASFLGVYSNRAGILATFLSNLSYIKRWILTAEANRMEKREKALACEMDAGFFVSPNESEEYNRIVGREITFSAGMGADTAYYVENLSISSDPLAVSFIGNMFTSANSDSLQIILNDILPLIKHDVTVKVIGRCPNELCELYSDLANVQFIGLVDDFRPVVESTSLFLAPIAYGSGIKTKIVEAMAMGMCVVTNSVGAEGLTAENGREIVIRDSPEDLAAAVDGLLDDEKKRDQIGRAARAYAVKNHRWDSLLAVFGEKGF